MEPDSIAKRLIALRTERGLSVRQLALLAGVPQSTLSLVENGKRPGSGLTLATAAKLCWTLGVGLGEFAGSLLGTSDHSLEAPSRKKPLASLSATQ